MPLPYISSEARSPVRHETLWFPDGNIVLAADGVMFNVHRGFLCKESAVFSELLELPLPEGSNEGTEAQPLVVSEVSGATLGHILGMLYTPWGSEESHLNLDVEAYERILRAAHRLQFGNLFRIAHVYPSQHLSPVKKLNLALSHCGLDAWAFPAFRGLVEEPHEALAENRRLLSEEVWHAIWRTRDLLLAERRRVSDTLMSHRRALDDGEPSPRLCDAHLLHVLAQWNALPLNPIGTKTVMSAAIGSCKSCTSCATRGVGRRQSPGELVHVCLDAEKVIVEKAFEGDIRRLKLLALNFVKIPYETHWLSFVEIEPYFKSIGVPPTGKQPGADRYTCPSLHAADATIVAGSTAIIEYLDAAFPDTPSLLPPGTRALQEAFDAFFDAHVREAMAPVCAPGFPTLFDAASADYFRRTRAAWHPERLPLDQWAPLGSEKRAEAWREAEAGWGRLAAVYSERERGGPWLAGTEPVFADFVALAGLCCMQKAVEKEEWVAVLAWHDGLWAELWEAGRKYMEA